MASLDLLQGKRRAGAVVNIAAAGAGIAVAIMTASTFANMVGLKTFIIKRLKIRNNGCPNTWVHIGTGVGAGVDRIPALYSVANTTDDYEEGDLPAVEFGSNAALGTIVAWVDAVGGGTFDVQVEVEELG
jgi:hypothetical protein